ncbi:hypothetical protein LR48_Vigan07g106600 [Vigna angularis]|uniref:Uncharacterized protein n=1 Tax=Phaseolus angularis TaxID=3914 RepID=A0A0L9UXQ7_PHAAN|nr:hypothetical protein LR48_Vigan07g106600 [Vigna angularis]
MVTTRNMEEQQRTRELIGAMQAQVQARLLEMQRKHEEEVTTLRAEHAYAEQSIQRSTFTTQRDRNHDNNQEASHSQQPPHPINPNNRERRQANSKMTHNPTPLQTTRPHRYSAIRPHKDLARKSLDQSGVYRSEMSNN